MVRTRGLPDREEKDLIVAYERREFRPVRGQKKARTEAVDAARRYVRRDAQINIRLSSADLEMLKRRTADEGLPYQSLIASIRKGRLLARPVPRPDRRVPGPRRGRLRTGRVAPRRQDGEGKSRERLTQAIDGAIGP